MALLSERFLDTLQSLITQHHTVYPHLPPQGIFFEVLVERSFHLSGSADARIASNVPNAPGFDIVVANQRFSVKSETGRGTRLNLISITKLCTTERDPWEGPVLVSRVVDHLSRYEHMMMLRAVWPAEQDLIHYQLIEVPLELLRLIRGVQLGLVGRRRGRQSLGGDVIAQGNVVFHVHFDGSDGKCQIRNLRVDACHMLRQWDQRI